MSNANKEGFYSEDKFAVNVARNGGFQKILETCFVDGIKVIVGDSGALSAMTNWKLGECLKDPKEFHSRLLSFLDEPGTTVIERSIAKQLFRAIGQPYPKAEAFNFESFLNFAKRMYESGVG